MREKLKDFLVVVSFTAVIFFDIFYDIQFNKSIFASAATSATFDSRDKTFIVISDDRIRRAIHDPRGFGGSD